MNTKTIKTVPIIINNLFLISFVFYRSILDTYSNIIIEKEFTDFTARFPAFKNSEFISDTFYSITDMQSEKKDDETPFTIMISVLINSTKYDIYKYKINNSRHLNFYVKAIKQFFLHKQEYVSKYIIDNFKISAKAILYKELNRIKQTFSINAISKPEKSLKYKEIKSFLKLINNKTIYKFYPENFTYNLIICLDNTETINETIDTEKIKNTIFNDIKNSKNNSQYFNQYFKNTLTNTDTYISKNNIQNEDTITYIYVNLKIMKNIYINLVSFYYINKANTINPDKFSNAINNLIAESKLYSLLNYPDIPETKLISKISKLPADSSFYSITDYSLIKHNSDDLLHTNILNYLDEYKYNVTNINVYCTYDNN